MKITPTQKQIDIVADVWDEQEKWDRPINLCPDTCEGMTQEEIDNTTEWLYSNN